MKSLYVCLALAAVTSPAMAEDEPPVPICARHGVMVQVMESLHRAGRDFTVEKSSIGQAPTSQPNVVRCAVRVHTMVFDTNTGRHEPSEQITVFEYSVLSRGNGLFMRPLDEHPL